MNFGLTRQAKRITIYLSVVVLLLIIAGQVSGVSNHAKYLKQPDLFSPDSAADANNPDLYNKTVVADIDIRSEFHLFGSHSRSDQNPDAPGWHKLLENLYTGRNPFRRTYLHFKKVTVAEAVGLKVPIIDDIVLAWDDIGGLPYDVSRKIYESHKQWEGGHIVTAQEVADSGWQRITNLCWVHFSKYSSEKSIADISIRPDVYFDPRPNWELKGELYNKRDEKVLFFFVKRGVKPAKLEPVVLSAKEDKFSILQLSDLHLDSTAKNHDETVQFLDHLLQEERPDLVVLTGDQFDIAKDTSMESLVTGILSIVSELDIPFAVTFGSRDLQDNIFSREKIVNLLSTFPKSVTGGSGDYVLKVGGGKKGDVALELHFLDSSDGILSEEQLQFHASEHQKIASNQLTQPLGMAFTYRPLPEYRGFDKASSENRFGSRKVPISAVRGDEGAKDVLEKLGVQVISVGADHENDFCLLDGLWMCYGGVSGDKKHKNTVSSARVFEVDISEGSIKTWQRQAVYLETNTEFPGGWVGSTILSPTRIEEHLLVHEMIVKAVNDERSES